MNHLIKKNLPAIRDLCQAHQVSALHAFGSVLRPDFGPNSDVDFLVVFDPPGEQGAFRQYFELKEALEMLLDRNVDLVSARSITNPFFMQQVESTKQPVYAA